MKLTHALVVFSMMAAPALANDHSGHGKHSGHGQHSGHASEGPMKAYMATMDTMMKSMDGMAVTNDPDIDFLVMMIPHHQSAIDMAKVQLELGKDPKTRALSQEIIKAQEKEIADMQAMITRLKGKAATKAGSETKAK